MKKEVFDLTVEQEAAILAVNNSDSEILAIESGSGTSKSKTIVFALEDKNTPHKSALILAFNSKIAKQNRDEFPDWCDVRTLHSLAYRYIVGPLGLKVKGSSTIYDFKTKADKKQKSIWLSMLTKYCQSDYVKVSDFLRSIKLSYKFDEAEAAIKQVIIDTETGKIEASHMVYIKLFQIHLLCKSIDVPKHDIVALDECLPKYTMVDIGNNKTRAISSIVNSLKRGEDVFVNSFNEETESFELKKAKNPLVSENRELVTVHTVGITKIHCTPNHKILTTRGYVMASELVSGDLIMKSNHSTQKTSKYLNFDQKQILLGSAFGDSHIDYPVTIQEDNPKNIFRLMFTQGEKQYGYLEWKASCFGVTKYRNITSGYTGKDSVKSCSTTSISYDEEITLEVVMRDIEPLGLAVWFMDDGSMQTYASGNKSFTLNSNNLSYSENVYVSESIFKKFGIKSKVQNDSRGYFRLSFGMHDTAKIIELIKPYIHSDLEYKFGTSSEFSLDSNFKPYGVEAVRLVEDSGRVETVYDFEVEDNHNFLIGNGESKTIVHNCQDATDCYYSIFLNLECNIRVGVGNHEQQLYGFAGANNAMQKLVDHPKSEVLQLSKSFRCSIEIAKAVEVFCKTHIREDMTFIGSDHSDKELNTFCHQFRTNKNLIKAMISHMNDGIKFSLARSPGAILDELIFFMVGVSKEYESIKATGDHTEYYKQDYREVYEEYVDFKASGAISFYGWIGKQAKEDESYPSNILRMSKSAADLKSSDLIALKDYLKDKNNVDENFVLASAQSVKGLSFDVVYINDDISDFTEDSFNDELSDDKTELFIYYTACTRAKKMLCNAKLLTLPVNGDMVPYDAFIRLVKQKTQGESKL